MTTMKYQFTLGIETTCDETSFAVVKDGVDIRSNVVASQEELHRKFGGVVPEVACRAHVEAILPVFQEACDQAEISFDQIDLIGVAHTPGLIGSLLIGTQAAKALSMSLNIPLIGVNHLQSHLYSCALTAADQNRFSLNEFPFPQIGLVVSGGHTGIYLLHSHREYELLGKTVDDAAGEAFDKVAALLSLPYPGGPSIQSAAKDGDPDVYDFPRPMLDSGDYRFSFSGLKTAVLYEIEGPGSQTKDARDRDDLSESEVQNLAASFQEATVDTLLGKVQQALKEYPDISGCSLAGGVAANERLREKARSLCEEHDIPLFIPPLSLCTDNGAMIAGRAYQKIQHSPPSSLEIEAIPT